MFAGPEKAVYSVGPQGVDLFAMNAQETSGGIGTSGSALVAGAKKQLDKISLQAYLEQVSCYEQLLKPITDIMQRSLSHSNPSAAQSDSVSGSQVEKSRAKKRAARRLKMFPGAMGAELETALVNIGAVEPSIDAGRPKRFTLGPLVPSNSPKHLEQVQKINSLQSQSDVITIRDVPSGRFKKISSMQPESSKSMIMQPIELNPLILDPASDRLRQKRLEDKKFRKRKNRKSAVIPWDLLDSLDGEKKRFEKEKLFVEFHKKF